MPDRLEDRNLGKEASDNFQSEKAVDLPCAVVQHFECVFGGVCAFAISSWPIASTPPSI